MRSQLLAESFIHPRSLNPRDPTVGFAPRVARSGFGARCGRNRLGWPIGIAAFMACIVIPVKSGGVRDVFSVEGLVILCTAGLSVVALRFPYANAKRPYLLADFVRTQLEQRGLSRGEAADALSTPRLRNAISFSLGRNAKDFDWIVADWHEVDWESVSRELDGYAKMVLAKRGLSY